MGAVTVNRDEVLRYLGYRRQEADDAVAELADTCLEELKRCTAAKYISRTFSMDIRGACVSFGGVAVHSDMLANHLEGCREVIAFAGTLGAPVDRLIHRYSQTTMSRAVVMQAAATAMLEAYCDEWMGSLAARRESEACICGHSSDRGTAISPSPTRRICWRFWTAGGASG